MSKNINEIEQKIADLKNKKKKIIDKRNYDIGKYFISQFNLEKSDTESIKNFINNLSKNNNDF